MSGHCEVNRNQLDRYEEGTLNMKVSEEQRLEIRGLRAAWQAAADAVNTKVDGILGSMIEDHEPGTKIVCVDCGEVLTPEEAAEHKCGEEEKEE